MLRRAVIAVPLAASLVLGLGADAGARVRRLHAQPRIHKASTSTAPTITSVSPLKTNVGQKLTILGKHFRAGKNRNRVFFLRQGGGIGSSQAEYATKTRIVVTSDLDEYAIAGLMAAPVDRYGVGTSLVTGSGAPTVGMVYKLVEREGVPVAKNSEGKRSVGGRKHAVRRHDADGVATAEVVSASPPAPEEHDRDLILPLVRSGELVQPRSEDEALVAARELHERLRGSLPAEAWSLSRGEPVIDTVTA